MAEYRTQFSPMRVNCTVGQPFGNRDSRYQCGFHTGVDFPASGAGGGNPDLYSITDNGTVVFVYKNSTGSSPALGNRVQILDHRTGLYYTYCHMLYGSITLNVGDTVNSSTYIGKMGNTGNSYGTHLHLEASTSQSWICRNFVDPCSPLGFPNTRGTVVIYDGTAPPTPPTPPEPPTPTPKIKKRGFNWKVFTRPIRNKRLNL